ncbi:MAG: DUF6049 family protein [Microbacterium sp.]
MTVTIPENGWRARLACAAVAFAMALGASAIAPLSAYAADQADETSPVLVVSAGSNGVVTPGLAATASVTVHNDTEAELATGHLTIELSRTALTDATAVTAWLEAGETADDFALIGSDSSETVSAASETTSSMAIPPESLVGLAPGVYPLRATLTGTGSFTDDISTRSVMVLSADQHPQATVFVPITATPADGSLLTADELTELTAADGNLTAQLDGVSGTSAVLAIDPAIIAAIRVLGTSAPTTAIDWLERLEELPNERFALQFGDADATTQAQADLPNLLGPTTLAPFLDAANFSSPIMETASPSPADTPSPAPTDGPVLPDDDALTALPGATEGILWPRADVTDDDLADFRAYLGGEASTILPSTAFSEARSGHASVGEEDVLVTDAPASEALSAAAAEPDADARAQSLAAANAYLFLAAQSSSSPLAVGLARDEDRTSAALREAVATADAIGVDLSTLRSTTATAATLSGEATDDRSQALQLLLSDEQTLGEFSSILDDPQVLLSPERIRILRVIGASVTASEFDGALSEHRQSTRDTLSAVDIPHSSTIQLLSANADLPFAVRNDLPWPVNVVLTVSPSDPRLDVQRVTQATIQAATTSRIKVPVSARVGSGELDLRLSLASSSGVPLGQQQTVRVAVRAEWEGIGLAIFGSLIVILIALGVFRTVRRRRQSADAGDGTDAGTDAAVTDAGESTAPADQGFQVST